MFVEMTAKGDYYPSSLKGKNAYHLSLKYLNHECIHGRFYME